MIGEAGLLLYRRRPHLQVLLAHPGAPMWQDEDDGTWIIPSYAFDNGQDPLDQVRHKFEDSFGFIPEGTYRSLDALDTPEGSMHIWAVEHTIPDDFVFEPYWFEMEWPPDSGQVETFPEMDRIEYFGPFEARRKIRPDQTDFIARLVEICSQKER